MKKRMILILITVVLFSSVFAQSPEEKIISANVDALHKGMIDADKSVLVNLLANELSYGHSSGVIENITEFIEGIISGKSDYQSINLADQTITVVDNIVIVRHHIKAVIFSGGKLNNLKLSVLQIWKKHKNNWKLLARHACKI